MITACRSATKAKKWDKMGRDRHDVTSLLIF
jgi:hypothetical protein